MGTGTQAHQLHSPQTGLGSLCACLHLCVALSICVHMRVCVCLETSLPLCWFPQMPGWFVAPLFGQEGVPSGPPS